MRMRIYLLGLYFFVCITPGICHSQVSSTLNDMPEYKFNFTAKESECEKDVIVISEEETYSADKGFGLINSDVKSYDRTPKGNVHDAKNYTGLKSDNKVIFRADLPPSQYWIEVYMDGGKLTNWNGTFSINGELIVKQLNPFHGANEGEEPPVLWTFLRQFDNTKTSVTIEVSANDQPTTIAAINFYKLPKKIPIEKTFKAPNADLAGILLEKGAIREAKRIIFSIPDTYRFEKAMLLLRAAGRLETEEPRSLVELVYFLLKEEAKSNNSPDVIFNLRLAELFIDADTYYKTAGWDWASNMTGQGIFTRMDLAGMYFEKICQVETHPLYDQALFSLGKVSYWSYIEEHSRQMISKADSSFTILKKKYQDHRLLKMYSGEQVAWNQDSFSIDSNIPAWVYHTSMALSGVKDIIHYWVDYRQASNGEFGGKYDDDVEMLRWWPIALIAMNDKKTLSGMQKLVNGIWDSDWIVDGFSKKVRDVEHAAEPVADTQPMMIGLDYGNPVYVERCMQSVKGMLNVWTGINEKGHRHFKSSWYSYNEIDTRPPRDCDVEMNTRTVKAARWLAWYNRHPLAMQFLQEWGDSWLEDCLRTDKGKPYGIVPSAIRFTDDAIGGHADNWHHPGMFWDYYNFRGGTSMLQQFVANYLLFNNPKYLEPLEEALKLVDKYRKMDTKNAEPGTEEWVAEILKNSEHFANTAELWRTVTGNSSYDEMLTDVGSDYLKFRLSGDFNYLNQGSKNIVDVTFNNRELNTTEAYFTDRVELRNIRSGPEFGANHLESLFAGSPVYDSFFPFYHVSWSGFDDKFAAVVLDAGKQGVTLAAFNITDQSHDGHIYFWGLEPGSYEIIQSDHPISEKRSAEDSRRKIIQINERGTSHGLQLPSKKLQYISVKQISKTENSAGKSLADLAITSSDILIESLDEQFKITVPVHNIGIDAAVNFVVKVIMPGENKNTIIAERAINRLNAPLDLSAQINTVEFLLNKNDVSESVQVFVDPDNTVPEINESNNSVNLIFK